MKTTKKPYYTVEFKQDAAQLILSKGYSYEEAANSLGVSVSALRKWVSKERNTHQMINSTSVKNGLTLSEHEELLGLRKEVNRLKMEREILKKAAVFFAQDHG